MNSRYQLLLAALLLSTGTINTIVTKYADISCAMGVDYYNKGQSAGDNPCTDRSEGVHLFDHPFVQALAMFVGEFLCIVVFKLMVVYQRSQGKPTAADSNQNWNPLIFFLPALCDCTATSTMYVGLTLTYASQFQMLRGSVVIFTGLMSRLVLKRKLKNFQWGGMFLVLCGLLVIGVSAFLSGGGGASAPNPILGDCLIIAAQVVVSLQMVVEEMFLTKHNVPALQAVGWEGVFGMLIMSILCLIFWDVPGPRAGGKFENINDAFAQFGNSASVKISIICMIFSIAFFNFSGVSVTKEMSATTRMVLDSVRTVTIWAYSLIVGWEEFQYLQVIGFVILLSGTFVYNDIIITTFLRRIGVMGPKEVDEPEKQRALHATSDSESDPLLSSSSKKTGRK